MAKPKKTHRPTMEQTASYIIEAFYSSVFPEKSPDEVMELLRSQGWHSLLLEFFHPETDRLRDMEYANWLDGFESELADWVEEAHQSIKEREASR